MNETNKSPLSKPKGILKKRPLPIPEHSINAHFKDEKKKLKLIQPDKKFLSIETTIPDGFLPIPNEGKSKQEKQTSEHPATNSVKPAPFKRGKTQTNKNRHNKKTHRSLYTKGNKEAERPPHYSLVNAQ